MDLNMNPAAEAERPMVSVPLDVAEVLAGILETTRIDCHGARHLLVTAQAIQQFGSFVASAKSVA